MALQPEIVGSHCYIKSYCSCYSNVVNIAVFVLLRRGKEFATKIGFVWGWLWVCSRKHRGILHLEPRGRPEPGNKGYSAFFNQSCVYCIFLFVLYFVFHQKDLILWYCIFLTVASRAWPIWKFCDPWVAVVNQRSRRLWRRRNLDQVESPLAAFCWTRSGGARIFCLERTGAGRFLEPNVCWLKFAAPLLLFTKGEGKWKVKFSFTFLFFSLIISLVYTAHLFCPLNICFKLILCWAISAAVLL